MKVAPIQSSFNGGELSPYLAGRVDVTKYANGCERMENFLPLVQGPAIARPGLRFVAEVKNSAHRTWLMRFEFSATEAYMLEFGDQYVRFYAVRQRMAISGTPYELATPYALADLTNADGTFALRYAQTNDVVYLVHPKYAPRKLSRYGQYNWTLTEVVFSEPAFAELNLTATTVYASAATGTGVTLTASSAIFAASDVGRVMRLEMPLSASIPRWESDKALAIGTGANPVGQVRRSGANVYECITSQAVIGATNQIRTGTITPTHTEGSEADGDGGVIMDKTERAGVVWQYLHSGYGWVKVTGYTSPTVVTVDVISRLPAQVVGSGNPTARWAWGAWDAASGYPSGVTFFRERLVLCRDATLWFSVTGDFENFATKIGGVVTADAAFDRTIASDRLNAIRWMSPGTALLLGTLGDEWAVTEQSNSAPFGPTNVKTERQSAYGSSGANAVRVGDVTLFLQRSSRKLRAMSYQLEAAAFRSDNLAAFAEHIPSAGLVDMAWQSEPWAVLWAARSDGLLVGLSYDPEQEVVAWHRHPITGGAVECVETIPAPSGKLDDLWVIVRLTVNGIVRRYVCYLADEATEATAQADWFYVDVGMTYSGPQTTTVTGLDFLEGKEVWVLADGAAHPNRTVLTGKITLQTRASKVQVGLPQPAWLQTMQLNAGAANGTAQGKIKRIHAMTLRVFNSLGAKAGPRADKLEEMRYRYPSMPMGVAPPPFTGDLMLEWDADYDSKAAVVIHKDKPMPVTLVAAMPQLDTSEGR